MFAALPSATGFIQGKRVKALAVTSPKRAAAVPDVPTVIEAGVPGIAVMEWYGIFAPAGTPRAVINKLNAEVIKVIQKPDVRARMSDLGADPVGNAVAEFDKQIRDDIAMWSKVVEFSGARAD
jgi:tripartite-type tricarboxylate transporter receptor subunit TctC